MLEAVVYTQVHTAFKAGSDASGWQIDKLLSSIYWLFKDTPARREDFTACTSCTMFPLKFCGHRWLENVPVCERAIVMYDHVVKYVTAVREKKYTDPKTKSFSIVAENVNAHITPAKLAFFLSVANQLQPFLTKYQTDVPMLMFLFSDLNDTVKHLLERFVKQDVIKATKDLSKLDVTKSENLCDYAKVDVGFSALKILKGLQAAKKISDRQVLDFRMECRSFLAGVVRKIMEKSPLKYQLVKNMTALDPRLMAKSEQREQNKTKMRSVIQKVVEAGRCCEQDVDEILRQYLNFIDSDAVHCTEFRTFCPVASATAADGNRVDVLLHGHLAANTSYSKLWFLVKQILLLSHGQAAVERGFSVNKQTEADNMNGDSFVAKRLVLDHLRAVGGICNVDNSNKQLLLSCSAARQRYHAYLDEEKKQKEATATGQKRKKIEDEIDGLKKKKQAVHADMESLLKAADEFADKAEKAHDLTCIAKSNSLRRAATEKGNEIKTVDQQLDDKLLELRNC
jgi:hypothetical protein